MKRYCFVLAVLVFVSSFVFAQNPDDTPVEWKMYEPPDEEFSVELPSSVSVSKNTSGKKDSPILYSSSTNKTFIYVTSGKEDKIPILNDIRNLIKSEKTEEQDISVDDFTASKYSFVDSENFLQTIVLAKGKKRFYIFHAVGEEEDNSDIKRFISSIKFNRKILETPELQPPSQEPEVSVKDSAEMGSGVGRGSGMGSGSGSGSGIGRGITTPKPTPSNQTLLLKILYKPKPSYTNLARYYSMQGTVRVRVTFMADGKIGSVTAIKKLPFGLTNSAINAAKQMRFEPPLRDGTPYTVVKLVEYSFTIY